jgi:hypothetical protein
MTIPGFFGFENCLIGIYFSLNVFQNERAGRKGAKYENNNQACNRHTLKE